MMDLERFKALAQSYGSELARWPEGTRGDARGFVAAHPEQARRILAEEEELDASLGAYALPAPDAALMESILASARVDRPARPAAGRPALAALAACVCLTVGLGAGWSLAAGVGEEAGDELFSSAFTALETELMLDGDSAGDGEAAQ